jgi:hypothetical protein
MHMKSGQRGHNRWEKMNRPPASQPWIWITREMMESAAWQTLTAAAKRIVERIMLEHMHNGGKMNGELIVTYDDFVDYGISRKAIKTAIDIAQALGFIEVTVRGRPSYGAAQRPSQYAITWLPKIDGSDPTNRWKATKSKEQAARIIMAVRERQERRKLNGSSGVNDGCKRAPTQDI